MCDCAALYAKNKKHTLIPCTEYWILFENVNEKIKSPSEYFKIHSSEIFILKVTVIVFFFLLLTIFPSGNKGMINVFMARHLYT